MKPRALLLLLALILLCPAAEAAAQGASPGPPVGEAGEAFFAAQALEQKGDYQEAIEAYLDMAEEFPKSPYAGEAVLRVAVINDDKLYDPPEALKYYREYLQSYGGRQKRRAEIRVQTLAPYERADVAQYREYRAIVDQGAEHLPEARGRMEAFINRNPDCPFLDEALLWMGNEYRGFRRGITTPEERVSVEKAIPYYIRIIREYPDSGSYLYALKNLADCYRLLGDYQEGRRLYYEVIAKGGDFGRMLVGNQMTMLNLDVYRTRVLYGALLLFVSCLAGLFLLVDFSRRDMVPALLAGLRKCLYFLPVAALLVLLTWFYTDAKMGNIAGTEPLLVGLLCAIAMLGLLMNEVVVRADGRRRVPAGAYLAVLAGMVLSLIYLSFYILDLLPYAERLFIPA